MPRLYEMTEGLLELLELADDEEQVAEEEWVEKALEFLGEEVEDKLLNCSMVVKQLEADAGVLATEKARLAARQASFNNRAKSLKDYMTACIVALGVDKKGKFQKFKNELFSVYIQKNPRSFDHEKTDWKAVPEEFVVFEPRVDNRAAMDHFKNTGEIPSGMELKEESFGVRIR